MMTKNLILKINNNNNILKTKPISSQIRFRKLIVITQHNKISTIMIYQLLMSQK